MAGGGIPEPRRHLSSPALGPAPGCPEQPWLERLWGFSKLVYLVLTDPSSFCEPPCLACRNALYFICLILPWYKAHAVKPGCAASGPSDAGARSPAPCGGAGAGHPEALVPGCDSAQVAHRAVTTSAVFPAWHKMKCCNHVPTIVSLGQCVMSHLFFFCKNS